MTGEFGFEDSDRAVQTKRITKFDRDLV